MTDLSDAYTGINTQIRATVDTLLTEGVVNEIVFNGKQKGGVNPPSLGIISEDIDIDDTMMGGSGTREAWSYQVRIRSLVKSHEDPILAMTEAVDILSEARNLILADRRLGLPEIVIKIDSSKVRPIPFPIGKKTSLYAADCYFNILFYINNE